MGDFTKEEINDLLKELGRLEDTDVLNQHYTTVIQHTKEALNQLLEHV